MQISIFGNIEFQSNSLRNEGCHLVYLTFLGEDDRPITGVNNSWWRAFAIKVNPTAPFLTNWMSNENPFIYNLVVNGQNIDNCIGTLCPLRLGVFIIPCCRVMNTNSIINMPFTNDPNNPGFLTYNIPTNSTTPPNAPDFTWDGYVFNTFVVTNLATKACRKVVIRPLNNGLLSFQGCNAVCSGTVTNPPINNTSIDINNPLIMTTPLITLCVGRNADIPNPNPYVTIVSYSAPDQDCCNTCSSFTIPSYNNTDPVNATISYGYQRCDGTYFQTQINVPAGGTSNSVTFCAIPGSAYAVLSIGASNTLLPINSNTTSCTPTCPDCLGQLNNLNAQS